MLKTRKYQIVFNFEGGVSNNQPKPNPKERQYSKYPKTQQTPDPTESENEKPLPSKHKPTEKNPNLIPGTMPWPERREDWPNFSHRSDTGWGEITKLIEEKGDYT